MTSLLFDIRASLRQLTKEARFTMGLVLVLALGLAVNTTIFTIVNGMTWRTLPVPHGDRVVHISSHRLQGRRDGLYTSIADIRDWRASATLFSGMAAFASGTMNLGDDSRPADRLAGAYVDWNTFRVLGVPPIVGRDFMPTDGVAGNPHVVLIAHHVWTARYAADPSIVGRSVRLNGTTMTIAGVMPSGFQFPLRADVWQPLEQYPGLDGTSRDQRRFDVVARLADDAGVERARAEMQAIAAALAVQHPASNRDIGVRLVPFTHAFVAPPPEAREPLVVMIAAAIVLLIACANGANLFLARAADRTREMAMRATLGATRLRILRQLLVEAVIVSAIAALLGLAFTRVAVWWFTTEAADLNLPFWIAFEFDARVFAYVAAACLGSAIACGLVPAWQLSRVNAHALLKEGAKGASGSRRTQRWKAMLLTGELALTLTLLGAADALIRSSATLGREDARLDLDGLVTAQIALPPNRYETPESRRALHARLREGFDQAAGLSPVAISSARPFVDSTVRELSLDPASSSDTRRTVQTIGIDGQYFAAMGLSMLRGRALTVADSVPGSEAVVINDQFAAAYFAGGDPLGRRIGLGEPRSAPSPARWFTVVGVAPSIRQRPMSRSAPLVYMPLDVHLGFGLAVTVHGGHNRDRAAAALREVLQRIDADVAIYNLQPLRRLSELSRWPARLVSLVLTILAMIASVLSAGGVYALTAYGVSQRTPEIGLRMALGARREQIAWFFIRTTMTAVVTGVALGVAGALAVRQVLSSILTDTAAADPFAVAALIVFLTLVVVAACFFPARRAVRLDPAVALRRS
jgi:predicted permease